MSLFSPFSEASRGLRTYLRGVKWLRENPRFFLLLMIPGLVGLLFLIGGLAVFTYYEQSVLDWLLFTKLPDDAWYWGTIYGISRVLLYVAMVVMTLLFSMLLMNVVASPIYDAISIAVEREVTGREPPNTGLRGTLSIMLTELKKVLFIFGLSIILLLIPGFNVISTLFAAFLVGWDFFDYPLARRGWSFGQRLRFVGGNFWSVLGFGLWLVIPFAQLIMLPLAVAGGTLLSLEALERDRLLTPTPVPSPVTR